MKINEINELTTAEMLEKKSNSKKNYLTYASN